MAPRPLVHEPWTALAGLRHGFLLGGVEPETPVSRPRQVHGTRVVTASPSDDRPEADGLVTASRGTLVGVTTADCVPILLAAPGERVAAAVHAGWRGAAAGVVEAAVAHLRTFGVEPAALEACLGPAIGQCCYEVGREVRAAFVARSGDVTAAAWSRRRDRDVLDLRRAVRALLEAAGVSRVAVVGPCTRCTPELCSYRRDGSNAGRQVSFIGWA